MGVVLGGRESLGEFRGLEVLDECLDDEVWRRGVEVWKSDVCDDLGVQQDVEPVSVVVLCGVGLWFHEGALCLGPEDHLVVVVVVLQRPFFEEGRELGCEDLAVGWEHEWGFCSLWPLHASPPLSEVFRGLVTVPAVGGAVNPRLGSPARRTLHGCRRPAFGAFMRTALSAKKMTSQEKKALERSGAKNKNKTKVWVKVSDKGSKNKRGKWTGNATFEFKGDDKKHAMEIPLRTGDVLKLKGKDLWVHPKSGDEFKFGDDEEDDEEMSLRERAQKMAEEGSSAEEIADELGIPEEDVEEYTADDDDDDDDEEAEEKPKKGKKKGKKKDDEDDGREFDTGDEDEGTGPLSDEEIAEMDEEEALEAEQEKLTLRKKALAAEKKARIATSRAKKLRAQVGGSLKKQVEEEGVEKTGKSVAGKLVKVAAKLTLKGFVKALFLIGGAIQSGGKAIKQLGPAIKKEIESERKKLADVQKSGMSDIIDAEFTVIDKNLKAVQDDKWLLGPVPSSGKLPPADDSDLPDSMSPKQLAAPQKKDKTKPPPLPKKKSAFAGMPPEKIDSIKAKVKPNFSWKDSTEEEEGGELDRAAEDAGLDADAVREAFKKATKTKLDDDVWEKLENTDSWETTSVKSLAEKADEYGRDWRRVVDGLTTGVQMPRSIVLKKPDGTFTLVGGNTRLMAMRALGIKPEVMVVDMAKPKKAEGEIRPSTPTPSEAASTAADSATTDAKSRADHAKAAGLHEKAAQEAEKAGDAAKAQYHQGRSKFHKLKAKPKPKPKPKPEDDDDIPMAEEDDVVEAAVRRLQAALVKASAVKAGPNWSMSHPSYDSLDAMDPEDESIENSVKMLRGLARSKANHLDATHLRILADALERGGIAQAVKRLKNIERSMDEDDFARFSFLLPNLLLRSL